MNAKMKPRIDLVNRTALETVIPLDTPFILMVEPTDACNFQCKFCPTGDRALMKTITNRQQRPMEFSLYKKIVDDCRAFPRKIRVMRLYKDGEPLLNRRFSDMVAYAKKMDVCERVDTTTNAALLTHELSDRVIDAGLDRINISIEGVNAMQYLDFSGVKLDFEKLVGEIDYFYQHRNQCEMIVKINGDSLSEEDKDQFYQIFGDIADGVSIESVMSCWHDFELKDVKENKEVGVYGQPLTSVDVCPYVFYEMAINADGTASVCFLDWMRTMLIGDVHKQSVREIWDGTERYGYLAMFLRHERSTHDICRKCGQLTHGAPDDIDKFAEALLPKVLARMGGQG